MGEAALRAMAQATARVGCFPLGDLGREVVGTGTVPFLVRQQSMTGGVRVPAGRGKAITRAVVALAVGGRSSRLTTPGLQKLGWLSLRSVVTRRSSACPVCVEGWVVGGCVRGFLDCRSWSAACGSSTPANSRLGGGSSAHLMRANPCRKSTLGGKAGSGWRHTSPASVGCV